MKKNFLQDGNLKKQICLMVALLIIGLLSFASADKISSPETHKETIKVLDDKRENVMALAATTTAASTAISLIPGETGEPIANKLIDFSSWFIFIVAALFLEKYLITLTGILAFKWLIPIACLIGIVNLFMQKKFMKDLALKLVLLGISLFCLVPVSVGATRMIDETYQESSQQLIEDMKKEINTLDQDIEEEPETEDENILSWFTNKATSLADTVTDGLEKTKLKFETYITTCIEQIAVMLITSCVIPIAVFIIFQWLIKTILGMDIQLPDPKKLSKSTKKQEAKKELTAE